MFSRTGDSNKPDCLHCEHFFITWTPGTPRGCRLYGFKAAALPSVIVKKTSGTPCQGFVKKKSKSDSTEYL